MSYQIELAAKIEVADPKLLSRTWGFITSRISEVDFEKFVCEKAKELESVFTRNTVILLLEFNYKSKDVQALRSEIKTAIKSVSLPCECAKIPNSTRIEIQHGTPETIDYVDKKVKSTFRLIASVEDFAGEWQFTGKGQPGTKELFHEGNFYECQICLSNWLVIFGEEYRDYYFQLVDSRELEQSLFTKKWPWLERSIAGYEKVFRP